MNMEKLQHRKKFISCLYEWILKRFDVTTLVGHLVILTTGDNTRHLVAWPRIILGTDVCCHFRMGTPDIHNWCAGVARSGLLSEPSSDQVPTTESVHS